MNPIESSADDPRLLTAVQEYLSELEAGRRPDRRAYAARFPDLSAAMTPYLDALEMVHGAAAQVQSVSGRATPQAAELVGAEPLGDFHIVREIGRGGMGIVYEAVQRSLGRRVALKVLPFAAALDSKQLQRFRNEAQAAASLHHQNIVPVYAVGSERGVHFYAMQLIDGQNLAALIATLAPRPTACRPSRISRRRRLRCCRPTRVPHSAPSSPPSTRSGPRASSARLPSWWRRRPTGWITPTAWASCTATSSRRTCSSTIAATCGLPTSAWRSSRPAAA